MNKNNKQTLLALLLGFLLILSLTACGGDKSNEQDENLAVTQVVETAMAAITQTAAVQSPTPNQTPTFTPAPTSTNTPIPTTGPTPTVPAIPTQTSVFEQSDSEVSTCDIGGFIQDVTIPDGTTMAIGTSFTKTWKIENIGTCTWNKNYQIVFYGGTQMADDVSYRFTEEDIEPGEFVEISIDMTAPDRSGNYTSYWTFRNDIGQTFFVDGGAIYVEIGVGITPTPTKTPEPNDPPTIEIIAPDDEDSFTVGDLINFIGEANDPEDGDISSSIEWFSDIDGFLGMAANLNYALSEGTHAITAEVTDSDGDTDEVDIIVYVEAPSP